MRARDGVAIKECEKLSERVKERPVGEEADALVGVDGALGRGNGGRRVPGGRGPGGVRVGKAQLGTLLIAQALQREGLVKLDGSPIDLNQYRSAYQLTSSHLLLNTSSIRHCDRIYSLVSGNNRARMQQQPFNIQSGAKPKLAHF